MLPKFEIGTLLTREFVPYKGDESGFYRDMCLRVGKVRSPPPPRPLALDATGRTHNGASRLVQAMPAWSVKTRPGIVGM